MLLVWLAGCPEPDPGPPTGSAPTATEACPTGSLPEEGGCVPEACGAGPWGSVPVDDRTIYVAAGGTGDGTASAPLGSVQAALDRAAETGAELVAVGAGTYAEALAFGDDQRGVGVMGRCAALVTIDGGAADDVPAVLILGDRRTPAIALAGLTVTGGTGGGVYVGGADLSLTDVDLRGNTLAGLQVFDGEATLERVTVSGTLPSRRGDMGRGIEVGDGGTLLAADVVVVGNTEVGIVAWGDGTAVDLLDSSVTDTVPNPDGTGGYGVAVQEGAALTATGCTIAANTGVGLSVTLAGSSADLHDSAVVATVPRPDGTDGAGVSALSGGQVVFDGGWIDGNASAGVAASRAGAAVTLTGTSVSGTVPDAHGELGRGFDIEAGATLRCTRCTVAANTDVGLFARGEGASAIVTDSVIRDTATGPTGIGGRGVGVQEGAVFTATGTTIEGNSEVGVIAVLPGARVELSESSVLDTRSTAYLSDGLGVAAAEGGAVTLTGSTVDGNTGVGVLASSGDATVTLTDSVVQETARNQVYGLACGIAVELDASVGMTGGAISGTEGAGALGRAGGTLDLDAVAVTGNRFAGVVALDATVRVSDTTITDTGPDAEWGGGIGVYATSYFGAPTLSVTASTVGAHGYAAIWLDGPGAYDLEGNQLSGSDGVPIGAASMHGNAVFAENGTTPWDGDGGLRLAANHLSGAGEVAVLLHEAGALLEGNTWEANRVDVVQQHCTDAVPLLTDADLATVPTSTVCPPHDLLVNTALVFTSLTLPVVEPDP